MQTFLVVVAVPPQSLVQPLADVLGAQELYVPGGLMMALEETFLDLC